MTSGARSADAGGSSGGERAGSTRQDLIFRVFVSSTFSDMVEERNALQKDAFPELREYCRQRGARFQAIDLRWGVGQEAALDQQTMNICIAELRRCQLLSPRPNFIVLLGDRYGWRPLSAQIPAAEFDALQKYLTEEDRKHLEQWYKKDANATPPEYCLLPRTGEFVDPARWAAEETAVRDILIRAVDQALAPGAAERRKYDDSATHQEIQCGALEADDPQSHVFCYFRHITGLPEDASAGRFRDIRDGKVDADARDQLKALKAELKGLLPAEHVHDYEAKWSDGGPAADKIRLKTLSEDVKRDLQQVIDREVEAFRRRPDEDREARAHREFAADRCRHFVGRQDILRRIADYVASADAAPLIVHGKSGSGKTALMAKAWLSMLQDTGAVARFIGATPASSDLRSLLSDLCRQMGIEAVPTDMNELVNAFRNRLSPAAEGQGDAKDRRPMALFLDALDQLSPNDNARMLNWLPRELAPDVKLVLSVLETEPSADQSQAAAGEYDCFDIAHRIWPDRLVELGGLDESAGADLLETWLAEAGRTLRDHQRGHVLKRFRECPLPLYLKLAFEEARWWKSWEKPAADLAGDGLSNSIEGILDDLLARLELPQNHGRLLVGRALGYIASARNGLTEDELIDVLSADGDVMEWFYRQSPTEQAKDAADRIRSLPVVVWSRLFADIERYMTRRRADGTIVMNFYHRQVGEAVVRRYLDEEARVRSHLHLAEYFSKQDYWAESLEAQRARARRLPPTPRPANVRKVVELPYHRLEVAKLAGKDDPKSPHWDAVADLLTDWQFLEAKTEANPNFREQETVEPDGAPEAVETQP